MQKVLGISILFAIVFIFTAICEPNFISAGNIQHLLHWTALNGILGIGVAFVIISSGIDLSIGSVVGLTGCMLAWLLAKKGWSIPGAIAMVLIVSVVLGIAHGLLIAKLSLPPFIVTLCGLLIYRGATRWLLDDRSLGFEAQHSAVIKLGDGSIPIPGIHGFEIPIPLVVMTVLAVVSAVVLSYTRFGRHLFAVGSNQEAARFSGIATDRVVISAYVICSLMAGIGGVLFAGFINSMQPSGQGNFLETYAIAAAVLGGCSLRGGEGSILGVIVGTAVLRLLYNAINMLNIPMSLEFAVIGVVILAGVTVDEVVKRYSARRRAFNAG